MKRRIIFVALACLIVTALTISLLPSHSYAQSAPQISTTDVQNATYNYINAITIEGTYGAQKLEFHAFRSGPGFQTLKADNYPCNSVLNVDTPNGRPTGSGKIDLDIILPGQTGTACQNIVKNSDGTISVAKSGGPIPITIGSLPNSNIYFTISQDGSTISSVLKGTTFTKSPDPSKANIYVKNGDTSACPDFIFVDPGGATYTMYEMTNEGVPGGGYTRLPANVQSVVKEADACHSAQDAQKGSSDPHGDGGLTWTPGLPLGGSQNVSTPPGSTNPSGNSSPKATCETNGNPLAWILCPVFNAVSDASQFILTNIVQPFLVVPPVSTNPSDASFRAWSSFRIYGNIFLVIAILVIVFAESIGGGLIDAYTVKKVLPRILIAAILINLSVYIVAALVDLTNIAGKDISSLLVEPFKSTGQLNISLNGVQIGGVFGVGIIGAILGGGSILGMVGALLFAPGATISAALMAAFFIVLPILLSVLAIFATLVIRQGIILFLIIVSPFAFALYALPNTEQYFRKWWKLLAEALLVYPIIMIIFAVADILSGTILKANGVEIDPNTHGFVAGTLVGHGLQPIIAAMVAFILQFLPPAAAVLAFRIAGGAIGQLHGMVTGGSARITKMAEGRRDFEKRKLKRQTIQARGRQYEALGEMGDNTTGLRRWGARQLQRRVGGYNIHGAMAELTAEQQKEADAQTASGIDDEQRALTVNKNWANLQDRAALDQGVDANGNSMQDGHHVRVRNNRRQYRTLGGRWVSESNVDEAHNRWNGNQAQLQWAMAYEMQKATTQEQQEYLYQNVGRLNGAGSGFNMSDGEFGGLWTGAAFAKQNTDRQYKHYTWEGGANGGAGELRANGLGLMQEIDERQGNYAMSQQHAETWTTMRQEYDRAQATLQRHAVGQATQEEADYATEVTTRAKRIAAQFATQNIRAGGGIQGMDAAGNPIPAPPQAAGAAAPAGQEAPWMVSPTGAAGRAQEEMAHFVHEVLPEVAIVNAPGYRGGEGDARPDRNPRSGRTGTGPGEHNIP